MEQLQWIADSDLRLFARMIGILISGDVMVLPRSIPTTIRYLMLYKIVAGHFPFVNWISVDRRVINVRYCISWYQCMYSKSFANNNSGM